MKPCWQMYGGYLIAVTMGLGAPLSASAQYVWLNERGVKQYSDMPPPASVPAGKILKSPMGAGGKPSSAESSASAPASASTGNPSASKPDSQKTLAEQNAEFQKRRIEQAEKEKKAEEEARMKADRAKNCERARDYQRALDEGHRIARADKNGERAILTDEQRNQESQENRRILAQCK